jgi:WD40 repeat protein
MQVVLYQALTGRLCWVLGHHYGMVHSISWAKDDSAVVTASADFTVKLWHLPELPGPACGGSPQSSLTRHYSGMKFDRQQPPLLFPCSGSGQQQQATAGAAGAVSAEAGSYPAGLDACMSGGAGAGGLLDTSSCSAGLGRGQGQDTSCSSASLGSAAAAAGVSVSVLQHTCFVYAAEMHPTQQPLPTVVTAGFDGVLRLWSCDGVVLHSLLVS